MSKFNQKIKVQERPKTTFDLSHESKLSCNMGDLIPVMWDEISTPGEKWTLNTEALVRFAPLATPMMHRVNVYFHHFFVPMRLLLQEDDYNDFWTQGIDGQDSVVLPTVNMNNTVKATGDIGTLWDYLGLPTTENVGTITNSATVSALPFRAYQQIYNDWYRDPNLGTEIDFSKTSGLQDATEFTTKLAVLRRSAYEKDYFTSALPWTQRGDDVSLPIDLDYTPQYSDTSKLFEYGIGDKANATSLGSTATAEVVTNDATEVMIRNLKSDQSVGLDLSLATIPEFRAALALQAYLERNAVAGPRLIEQVLVNYGHQIPDYRAQRSEYLGGAKNAVQISEVLASTEATDQPLGAMGGHGISAGLDEGFSETFQEFGYVMTIMRILPKTAYYQGINRKWKRETRTDYPLPDFAHIGEQEVYDYELYHDWVGTQDSSNGLFGYQERFAEVKHTTNNIKGDYRDSYLNWHLARTFSTAPSLNEYFVTHQNDTAAHRVFADTSQSTHKCLVQLYFDIRASKPLPYFSTPKLMG